MYNTDTQNMYTYGVCYLTLSELTFGAIKTVSLSRTSMNSSFFCFL